MTEPHPDILNEIGVLKRREIEARIVAPLIERFAAEFGKDKVVELATEVVIGVARQQGASLAALVGGNDLDTFAGTLPNWQKDDALQIEVLEQSPNTFSFNVTRCRYAEMYRSLGVPELGALLSCNRDYSMVEGFNGAVELERTQTLMGGASHCDFRYTLPASEKPVELT